MKEYVKAYIKDIDNYINSNRHKDIDDVIRFHLRKIKFFQHERLIHLLVTLFYGLFSFLFTAAICLSKLFIPVAAILYIFLLFYIFHYFFLENAVQYMYVQHDKLLKIANRM